MRIRIAIVIALILAVLGGALIIFDDFGTRTQHKVLCQNQASVAAGQTFYIDPVNGSDGGDGSRKRPWRSLQRTIDAKLIGSQALTMHRLQYWKARLLGDQPEARLFDNSDAVVKDGDTILLSSGNHGILDLRGIINRVTVTISGAAGADARFTSMQIEGASRFAFQNLTVESVTRNPTGRSLINMRPEPTARRSDNIVFRGVRVGGKNSIAKFGRTEWAQTSSDGMFMFGDCLEVQASHIHDVHNGIVLYHTNNVKIEDTEIQNFSVDGIAFSGKNIAIRNNVIHDQWPTRDDLHPDCMQGQSAPGGPKYGPVLIEHNICLSDTAARHSELFQGINIFNGEWSDVTIRCNFVRPTIWHGISLYGTDNVKIEHNIVIGWPGVNTPWIASMPSGDQRQPKANLIAGNLSTGYLNAIYHGPLSIAEMFKNLQVNPKDSSIQTTLSQEITGVTLRDNSWLNPSWDLSKDKRFRKIDKPAYSLPVSIDQAKADIAALPDCRT